VGALQRQVSARQRLGNAAPCSRIAPAARFTCIEAELTYRPPLDAPALIEFLGARAVPGIEAAGEGAYRRSLVLPSGPGVIELRAGDGLLVARLPDDRDRDAAEAAARSLLDLDADPGAVLEALGGDPLIGAAVHAAPGRRVPGHPDPFELAIRAVIGQQVSVAGARTIAGRLVAEHGEPLARPAGDVTHLFPSAKTLAAVDPETLPMPRARGRALVGLARAVAGEELDLSLGADPAAIRAALVELPGIGPWTAEYVTMRALGDRDGFLASDLGVRRALERLGRDGSPRAATELAERWRPYRAYALLHLWSTLD